MKNVVKQNKLLNSLVTLGKITNEKAIEFKNANPNSIESIEMEYRPVKNLEFQYGVTFNYDREKYHRYTYFEWRNTPLSDFIRKEIMTTTQFEKAVDCITELMSPNRGIEDIQAFKDFIKNGHLYKYVLVISRRAIQNNFKIEEIKYYSEQLINDLTLGSEIHFKASVYLKLFSCEQEQFEIEPGTIIRRIQESELSETTRDFYESEQDKMLNRHSDVCSVIDIYFSATNDYNVRTENIQEILTEKYQVILNALRLIYTRSFHETDVAFSTSSVLHYTFDKKISPPFSEYLEKDFSPAKGWEYWGELKKEDVKQLQTLINKFTPTLKKISHESYFEGNHFEIAFHKYLDALYRSKLHIQRIANCMYCLDALFVEYDEKGKMNKLIHRASYFIYRLSNEKQESIKTILETAYQIRSRLVHGEKIDEVLQDFSSKNSWKIVNYTRILLLGFLHLNDVLSKREMIEKFKTDKIKSVPLQELQKLFKENNLIQG